MATMTRNAEEQPQEAPGPSDAPELSDTRTRLLAGALRLLSSEGPEALQVRRIAAEAGSSTMTVYTHFGSMVELRNAVITEGLARFGTALGAPGSSEDPIADLFVQGVVYRDFARDNTHLYRMMFGVSTPKSNQETFRDLTVEDSPSALPEGQTAFDILAEVTARAARLGRISVTDTVALAAQIWSAIHGYVLLEIAGFYGTEGNGVGEVLLPLTVSLLIGSGDSKEAVERSLQTALGRLAAAASPASPA
jgi:AcrR family transcriptional regulator